MDSPWYTTLFMPQPRGDASFRKFARHGDPEVEAAGSRPGAVRRLAQGPLPETPTAGRRGGGGTPFSAASGADLSPYGDSFSDWSNMVDEHARTPLPDYMRDPPAAEAVEPEPPRRGLEPGSADVPSFNSDVEMRAAMARARSSERVRAGTPTLADSIFLLVFGNKGGESTQERMNRELAEDVEARRRGD